MKSEATNETPLEFKNPVYVKTGAIDPHKYVDLYGVIENVAMEPTV
jgi:hypothetical protein